MKQMYDMYQQLSGKDLWSPHYAMQEDLIKLKEANRNIQKEISWLHPFVHDSISTFQVQADIRNGGASKNDKLFFFPLLFKYCSHQFKEVTYSRNTNFISDAFRYASYENGLEQNFTKIEQGESWKMVYGPFLVHLNSVSDGEDPYKLWNMEKDQALKEQQNWPYDFPQSQDYVSPCQRGSVNGQLIVYDRYNNSGPQPGSSAWIGLAPPGDKGSSQLYTKGYQFWTQADENGNFEIKRVIHGVYNLFASVPGVIDEFRYEADINVEAGLSSYQSWTQADENGNFEIKGVIPGVYNFFASVPGVIDEFRYEVDINVEAGSELALDHVIYEPPRNGPTLWEIGIPDRTVAVFFIPDPDPNMVNRLFLNGTDNSSELGMEAYPLLDELTSKISTKNLERVRRLKCRLLALTRRVQKVGDEIEQLMDDDGDMAEMYLTEKKRQMEMSFDGEQSLSGFRSIDGGQSISAPVSPVSSPPDFRRLDKSLSLAKSRHDGVMSSESSNENIEELEMLLEAYFVVIDSLLNKLTSLKEYIDDTEDFINIQLIEEEIARQREAKKGPTTKNEAQDQAIRILRLRACV